VEFPEIVSDGGHRVIIYSTNAGGKQPIHGAWFAEFAGGWLILGWFPDGKRTHFPQPSALDITEAIREKKLKIEIPA